VISTPPKSGTTCTQMLCALLIFDGPTFPAPLAEVTAALAAQTHRRFIKTHTPWTACRGTTRLRISWSAAIHVTWPSPGSITPPTATMPIVALPYWIAMAIRHRSASLM
jgi:hypothetical protein